MSTSQLSNVNGISRFGSRLLLMWWWEQFKWRSGVLLLTAHIYKFRVNCCDFFKYLLREKMITHSMAAPKFRQFRGTNSQNLICDSVWFAVAAVLSEFYASFHMCLQHFNKFYLNFVELMSLRVKYSECLYMKRKTHVCDSKAWTAIIGINYWIIAPDLFILYWLINNGFLFA